MEKGLAQQRGGGLPILEIPTDTGSIDLGIGCTAACLGRIPTAGSEGRRSLTSITSPTAQGAAH